MLESDFIKSCEAMLTKLLAKVEEVDKNSKLDVEYSDGVLEIKNESANQTYVINRNTASRKIWYSSPISGADYFSFDEASATWLNNKDEELSMKLLAELQSIG